jgi:hypothetical protein
VHPGAADTWYDGIDSDCAGNSDFDADADGHDLDEWDGDDCDDADPDIHAGAPDAWYDGVDSDCAGNDDFDQDADGSESAGFGGDDCALRLWLFDRHCALEALEKLLLFRVHLIAERGCAQAAFCSNTFGKIGQYHQAHRLVVERRNRQTDFCGKQFAACADTVAVQRHVAARLVLVKHGANARAIFAGNALQEIDGALRRYAEPLAQRRRGVQQFAALQYAAGDEFAREQRQRRFAD